MKIKDYLILVVAAFAVIFGAQCLAIQVFSKTNNVGKFGMESEQIIKDLDGRTVAVMFNQVWPFDSSQDIKLKVLSKKQLEEYVVVVVDVNALAAVQQPPQETPKEQFSTNPTSKEPVKPVNPPVKLPSKLHLTGRMKLTYELVDNDWYLIGVDNLNLKALPIN